jgi:MscS family membrane protein
MKLKFDTLFNLGLGALVLILCWSVWKSASGSASTAGAPGSAGTARQAGSSTNSISAAAGLTESDPEWIDQLAKDLPVLKHRVLGNELWKYLISVLYLFLAFYVAKLLDYLARVWLRKFSGSERGSSQHLLVETLNGPIKVVVFVIFLHIGLGVVRWPPRTALILGKCFTLVAAGALTYLALNFVDVAITHWRRKAAAEKDTTFDENVIPMIRKSLKLFILIVAVLVTAQNLGVNVTAALTSLSIGGLAVGLAAQDTLANLFGAVAVFVDKPFRIGDTIRLESVEGVVESIGMRSTRVRNGNGFLVTIPNKTVGNATIVNISSRPGIQTEMNLKLVGDTSSEKIARAVQILQEAYSSNPQAQTPTVSFNKFVDGSANLLVSFAWKGVDDKTYLAAMQKMNLQVKERLDAEGIRLAQPVPAVTRGA